MRKFNMFITAICVLFLVRYIYFTILQFLKQFFLKKSIISLAQNVIVLGTFTYSSYCLYIIIQIIHQGFFFIIVLVNFACLKR